MGPGQSEPVVDTAKLNKRLRRAVGRAITDFNMIAHGDHVMVCLSGGKDSFAMLDLLIALRRNAPIEFELTAVNLDQKQPGFPADVIPRYCAERAVACRVIEQDTYSIVTRVIAEDETYCGLCSRLRRGCLYTFAKAQGFDKIALGHHRDDILETFVMNLFHGGTLKTMPPKLRSDDGEHIVIRPLAYCRERDLAEHARLRQFPIIPCNLCGNQQNLEHRRIKALLAQWENQYPGRLENMFRALGRAVPSHLLDRDLYDFESFARRPPLATAAVSMDQEGDRQRDLKV